MCDTALAGGDTVSNEMYIIWYCMYCRRKVVENEACTTVYWFSMYTDTVGILSQCQFVWIKSWVFLLGKLTLQSYQIELIIRTALR